MNKYTHTAQMLQKKTFSLVGNLHAHTEYMIAGNLVMTWPPNTEKVINT